MDSSGIQSKKESEESQQIVSNNVENNKNEKSQDVDTTLKPKEITNPKIFNNPGHQYKKSVQLRECVTSERMRDSTYKPCYPERNPKEFTDNSENRDNRDPLYDNYGGNGVTHIDTHKNCKSGININIVSQQPCENIKLEKPLYTVSFKKCYDKEPELKSGNKRRVIHAMCGGKAKNCGNRMEGKNFRCTFENCCGKCESYIMEMQNNDCNSCNSCNDCNSAWQNNEEDCCCPREMEVVEDYQNPSKQCLQHVHFGSCPKAQNCARSDHSTCSFCSRKCTPSKASLFVEIGESVGNVCNLNSAQAFRCDSMELIDDCMRNEHCSVKRNKSDCFRSKHKCKKNEAKFNPNCQGRPGAMERSYSDGMPRMNLYVDNCTVETQEGWTEMRNTRSITFEETPVRKISTGSDPYLRKQEQCSKHCEHREHSSLTGDSRKGKIWTHLHDTYKSFVNKATTGIGQIVKQTSNKFKRSKTLPKDNHLCSKCASNIIYMDQFSQSEKCNKCAYDSCWQDVDIGQDSNKCEHCCRNMCCDGLPDCQTPMCQNNYSKPECDTREQIQPNTDNYLCGGVRDNFYNCNNDPLAEQLLSLLKCNRSRTKGGGDSFNQRKKQSSCNPRSSNNRGNTVQKNPTKQIVVRRSNPPQTNPPQTNAPQTNAPQTNAPQTNAPQAPARPITRVDVSVQTSFVDTTIDPLEPYTTIYPPSLETTYHRVTISPDQTGISITTSAIDKSQEIESIEDISDEYHRPPFVRRPVEMASIEEIEDVDESTIYRPLPDPRRRMLPPEIEPVDDTTVYRTLPPREEPPVTPEPRPVRRRVVPSPPSLPSPERAEWTPRYVSTPVRAPTPRRVVPSPPTEWTPPRYPPRTPPRPARPPDVRTPPPPPRRPVARPETPRTPPEPTPPPPARAIQCALVKEIRVICTPSLRDVTGRIGDVCACPSKEKVPPPPPVLPKVVTKEPGPPPKPEKPPPPKPETPPPPKPETPPPPKPETPPPAEVAAPEVTPEVVAAEEAPEAAEPPAEEAPAAEEAPEAAPAAEETPEAEAETPAEEKEASPAEEKEEERVEGGEGMHVESGEESPITDTPEEVATATTEEDLIESSDAKEEEERKAEKRELAASPRKEVTSASPEEVRTEVTEPPPLDMSRLPRIQVHTKIPIELARKLEGARTHVNVQMQTSNTILTQILSEFQTGTQKKQLMMSIKLHSDVDEDEDEDDFDIEELPVRRQLFVDDEDDDDEDLEHMRDIEHQPVRRPYPYPPSERVYTPRYDVSTNTNASYTFCRPCGKWK